MKLSNLSVLDIDLLNDVLLVKTLLSLCKILKLLNFKLNCEYSWDFLPFVDKIYIYCKFQLSMVMKWIGESKIYESIASKICDFPMMKHSISSAVNIERRLGY